VHNRADFVFAQNLFYPRLKVGHAFNGNHLNGMRPQTAGSGVRTRSMFPANIENFPSFRSGFRTGLPGEFSAMSEPSRPVAKLVIL
jgi:hypothetical protein